TGQPVIWRRGPGGGRRPAGIRFYSGLPLRTITAVLEGAKSELDHRPVLAYSVAQSRNFPGLPLERRAARRLARQRPARFSPALPLSEFPRDCRPDDRSANRPGTG